MLYVWSYGMLLRRSWVPPPPTNQFTLAFHWLLYPHRWDSSKSHSGHEKTRDKSATDPVLWVWVQWGFKLRMCQIVLCVSMWKFGSNSTDGVHTKTHMCVCQISVFLFEVGCVSDECVKKLTEAVSWDYVDLEDGHTASSILSGFTFDDNLSSNRCFIKSLMGSDFIWCPPHDDHMEGQRERMHRNRTEVSWWAAGLL